MSYFGKGPTILMALWVYNVPGLVVGAAVVGVIWWLT